MAIIRILPQTEVTDEHVQRAVALFKDSFGKWENGERIRYGAARLRRECLFDVDKCFMMEAVAAKENAGQAPPADVDDADFLGYCFFAKWGPRPISRPKVWISLLLVRPECRSQGLATSLLQACWNDTQCVAMGLVTSHPHAVLALERASQRLVTHQVVARLAPAMMKASGIPYLNDAQAPPALLENKCVVTTQFHADRTELEELRRSLKDWRFGSLERGQEYVAIVSRESPRIVALRHGQHWDQPDKEADQPDKESDQPDKESDQPDKESDQPDKESDQPDKESDQPYKQSDQRRGSSLGRVFGACCGQPTQ